MKILFVSTSIPPYPDMQSIRNIFLLQGLERKNFNISIITAEYPWINDDLYKNLSKSTKIFRTKPAIYIKFSKFLEKNNYLYILKKIFNILVNYITIPDIHMFWNIQAYKIIKRLIKEGNKYDAIVTSSGSYTAHLVGYKMSKKYNIKWVAEYGDPWGINEYGNKKRLNFLIEQKILKYCNGLVFTTKPTIDMYKPLVKKNIKFNLSPCGFDNLIEDKVSKYNDSENKCYEIIYTGVAYSGNRNLTYAIESITNSKYNVHLNMVGTFSDKFKKISNPNNIKKIKFTGRVSYNKSIELISKMDILLHIGNKSILQVPGKTYIYLSSKKPILYIRQEEKNDPTYNILKKFSGVIFCENNQESIEKSLNEIIENYSKYKHDSINRCQNKLLQEYKWSNIADDFAEFINNIIIS